MGSRFWAPSVWGFGCAIEALTGSIPTSEVGGLQNQGLGFKGKIRGYIGVI